MESDSDSNSYGDSGEELEYMGDEHKHYGGHLAGKGAQGPGPQDKIKDQHYDEVFEIPDDQEDPDVTSGSEQGEGPIQGRMQAQTSSPDSEYSEPKQDKMRAGQGFAQGKFNRFEESSGEEADPPIAGGYNPADYQGLNVSAEVKELFQYIQRYKPQHIELETKLKPFIPDYIPAIGEVDAFMKIPRPDGNEEELGLVHLDEPKLNQSDPALLELHLQQFFRRPGTEGVAVHSIENADKNPKKITQWIQSISDVHRTKPPPTVTYSKAMPDINNLMDVWHPDFEEALKSLELPSPDLDVDLGTYVRIVCGILDIPVYNLPNNKSLSESLHVLFTLYSDFKSNQHFKQGMIGQFGSSTGMGGYQSMQF
jgi:intraflagellar transport protein 46